MFVKFETRAMRELLVVLLGVLLGVLLLAVLLSVGLLSLVLLVVFARPY